MPTGGERMNVDELNVSIDEAKQNEWIREKMIRRYKPFILNTVAHLCKKYVSWSDEEASIGLISFNKAIDTYESNGGRTFKNYVYMLIKRDLIDFFRHEKKQSHLSFNYHDDEGRSVNVVETKKSIESYEKSIRTDQLVEEILALDLQLSSFRIQFEELEAHSPKHRDTREMLRKMATEFSNDDECVQLLYKKKKFPMKTFAKKWNYSPKTIERHRKYLITLILIHRHPEWVQLAQYIKEKEGGEDVE